LQNDIQTVYQDILFVCNVGVADEDEMLQALADNSKE
jgi:hypothetical protein